MLVRKSDSFIVFRFTRVGFLLLDCPLFETSACLRAAVAVAVDTTDIAEDHGFLLLIVRVVGRL